MKRIIIVIALVFCLIGAAAALRIYKLFFVSNTQGDPIYVHLYSGDDYSLLTKYLESSGTVINMKRFEKVAKYEKLPESVKSGRYKISAGMDNRQLARMFKLGWQVPINITISGNIREMSKLASVLSARLECDSISLLNALKDDELIDSLGFSSYSFPAMFLLNTYEVFWTITPKEIIKRFKKEYDTFWNSERMALANSIGLSPIEVSTLASIVSEESNLKVEHPIIAGVYINRLRIGMPLQADPTIKFALNDLTIKRILYSHLEIDSPYNTYQYRGLPPGPIVLPSPEIIDAVLNYTQHNYLYFCAKPSLDGSHSFAVNLSEHNRNAAAYHAAISRAAR